MIRRTLVVAALSVALALASFGPTASADAMDDPERTPALERIEAEFREAHEDLSDEGVMIEWTPWGPVEQPMTGEEMLDQLENLAISDADGTGPGAVAHAGAGNEELVLLNSDWPFCDYASIFVLYEGEPGERVIEDQVTPQQGPPVCGGFYGDTFYRVAALNTSDAQFDCSAAAVLMTTPAIPHGQGGYSCGHERATIEGAAAFVSYSFFDLAVDYFVGSEASVQTGPGLN